jgi:hypothetical protein
MSPRSACRVGFDTLLLAASLVFHCVTKRLERVEQERLIAIPYLFYMTTQFSSSFFLSRVSFPFCIDLFFPPFFNSSNRSRARGNWKATYVLVR